MTENELFVDNPLALTGLFPGGVFIPREGEQHKFEYHGRGDKRVLNIVYYDMPQLPEKLFEKLEKIMSAVVWNQEKLIASDYAIVNASKVMMDNRLTEIVADFKPTKTIVWMDQWQSSEKEVLFYQMAQWPETEMLRCHALHTVLADADRKKECWLAVKRLFGM